MSGQKCALFLPGPLFDSVLNIALNVKIKSRICIVVDNCFNKRLIPSGVPFVYPTRCGHEIPFYTGPTQEVCDSSRKNVCLTLILTAFRPGLVEPEAD